MKAIKKNSRLKRSDSEAARWVKEGVAEMKREAQRAEAQARDEARLAPLELLSRIRSELKASKQQRNRWSGLRRLSFSACSDFARWFDSRGELKRGNASEFFDAMARTAVNDVRKLGDLSDRAIPWVESLAHQAEAMQEKCKGLDDETLTLVAAAFDLGRTAQGLRSEMKMQSSEALKLQLQKMNHDEQWLDMNEAAWLREREGRSIFQQFARSQWFADASKNVRLAEMTKRAWDWGAENEDLHDLRPDATATLRRWLKEVAECEFPHAMAPGRPRKTKTKTKAA